MKFLSLIFVPMLSFANPNVSPVLKDEIKQLADRVYTEAEHSRATDSELLEVKRLLEDSINLLLQTGTSGNTLNDCMKYVMDQGYPPPIAKDVCQNLNKYSFQCVRYLGGEGYPPQNAKMYCQNMNTQPEEECMEYIVEKAYGPQTGTNICTGVTRTQFSCIKSVMERGYDPMSAKRSC